MSPGYGSQSMVERLRTVLVRRPDHAFAVTDPLKWHYAGRPELDAAQREHDGLVAIFEQAGAQVVFHTEVKAEGAQLLNIRMLEDELA